MFQPLAEISTPSQSGGGWDEPLLRKPVVIEASYPKVLRVCLYRVESHEFYQLRFRQACMTPPARNWYRRLIQSSLCFSLRSSPISPTIRVEADPLFFQRSGNQGSQTHIVLPHNS